MSNGNGLDGLTLKDLARIYNAIAQRYEDVKKVSRFSDRKSAVAKIMALLKETGDKVIRLLEPEYVKRGAAAARFPFYKDGMLASEYVELCKKDGHTVGHAKRDLRYDNVRGLIKLV